MRTVYYTPEYNATFKFHKLTRHEIEIEDFKKEPERISIEGNLFKIKKYYVLTRRRALTNYNDPLQRSTNYNDPVAVFEEEIGEDEALNQSFKTLEDIIQQEKQQKEGKVIQKPYSEIRKCQK